jgi:hypothetical protein
VRGGASHPHPSAWLLLLLLLLRIGHVRVKLLSPCRTNLLDTLPHAGYFLLQTLDASLVLGDHNDIFLRLR